jgi:hypothetical protein
MEDRDFMDLYFEFKYLKINNPQIYTNKKELLNEFKEMEAFNLILLEQYNKNNVICNQVENEYNNYLSQQDSNTHLFHTLFKKENAINILRKSNKTLNKRSHSHLNESKGFQEVEIKLKEKKSQAIIQKLKEIYKLCLIYEPNEVNLESKGNLNSQTKKKEIVDLRLDDLKKIEKVLRIILTKYYFYLKIHHEDMARIEKDIEVFKKEEKALGQQEAERNKQEKNKRKIMERFEKQYVLPKRRVMMRYPPKEKKIENVTVSHKTELKLDEFNEFLTYDSDF